MAEIKFKLPHTSRVKLNTSCQYISNPCPAGFRVPTAAELIAEKNSWISQNLTGAFASPLKLTTAGARGSSGSSIYGTGYMGFYWSSAVDGSRSVVFQFDNSNANTGNYTRAIGLLIRCIKD